MNYFYTDDTPTMPGYYIIRVNHEAMKCKRTLGSFQLLEARLLGISYANYLRLCRDSFGATIFGKNSYYPVAYFKDWATAQKLIELLNERAATALEVSNN